MPPARSLHAAAPSPGSARPGRFRPTPTANTCAGRIAVFEGDYAEAIRRFRTASAAQPTEAPIQVALIDVLTRAGHHSEASRAAELAQKRWSDDAGVWLASGAVYRRMGVIDQAIRAYQRAIELEPDLEEAYLGLASSYIALSQPRQAERTYRALITRRPSSIPGRYRLAKRLMRRNAYSVAERHLRLVLELDPDHVKARVALAKALRSRGKKDQALDTLREAFDRSSGDARVGDLLVRRLLEAGDRDGAVALLGLLDRDDLSAGTRLSFGDLYLQLGELALAMSVADSVLAGHPVSGQARLLKANVLAEMSRWDEAVALLLEVAPERNAFPECRARAAELLAKRGNYPAAVRAVEEALSSRPRDIDLVIAHARVEELGGHIARAREIYGAAVAARPSHAGLLYALAAFEDRQGRPDRAVSIMERVLEAEPDNVNALNFIGFSLADRNIDLIRAERLLSRALDSRPGDAYILDSYGWLLFRQKRFNEARTALEQAARLVPREPEILWHLGELHLSRDNRAQALELFERARTLGPEPRVLYRIEARIQAIRTGVGSSSGGKPAGDLGM